jgi:hypothetical protein
MKKTIKILAAAITFMFLSSFAEKFKNGFTGTYGVSASDPAQIKLILRPDHTFYYQDFSDSGRKIAVDGNWTFTGKKVILTNTGPRAKFHDVWTFAEHGQVAKSRKGLTFYRLKKTD